MKPSVYTQIYQDGLLILKLGNEDLINGRSQRSDLKENRKKILSGAMRDKDLPQTKNSVKKESMTLFACFNER